MRIADVHDASTLKRALDGVECVISTVAPFTLHGFPVARAAADLGIGYVDSTGEGSFTKRLADELDAPARSTGATLCPGTGASAFLGDIAIQTLLKRHPGARSGGVLYDIRNYTASFGTLLSYLTSILPAGGPALRAGTLIFLPFGAYAGAVAGIQGFHGLLMDPAVIARYWRPPRFDALFKGSPAARPLARAVMGLVATAPVRWLLLKLPLERMAAFNSLADAKASVTVHAEVVDDADHSHQISLRGESIYDLTARVLVSSAQAMLSLPDRPRGVRAASELFQSLDQAIELTGVRQLS
jgi:hypothetical protein